MTGPAALPDAPRIFVSHSHSDNAYCRAFVVALRHALGSGEETVWYDEHNLGWGNIRRTIERELEQRQHFIAILSPAAVESQWVNDEIDAALGLLREGQMRTVAFVTAEKCDVPRLLRGYKRVEAAGGEGYPPAEAAARVLRFIHPAAASPTSGMLSSAGVVMLGKPDPAAPHAASGAAVQHQERHADELERRGILMRAAMPRDRFPKRLEQLGFTAWKAKDPETGKPTELILPPLCPVPAGPFLMGSRIGHDMGAFVDELPAHDVPLPAYQIGKFPVTVAEYACFVAAGRAAPQKGLIGTDWQTQLMCLDHPVTSVASYDAMAYTAWLGRLTGQLWKLPSEEEWEKAARWDEQRHISRLYPWGDYFDALRCNISESLQGSTTPVGKYGPEDSAADGSSPCGAQDMAGNVWEWTRSVAQLYRDQQGDSFADAVMRGGSWRCRSKLARGANRSPHTVGFSSSADDIGFRCILSVE